MELPGILNRIYPLPQTSVSAVSACVEQIELERHTVVIDNRRPDRNVFFVRRGLLRAYVIADGREITFWIGDEGSVALSMESYVNGMPGYEVIETIEDSSLFRISLDNLEKLYLTDIHLANWGRKFAEKEIIRAERCLIPQLHTTATHRYLMLMRENPMLVNRVPQEYLASYLGVTPVSLSRIRADVFRKK